VQGLIFDHGGSLRPSLLAFEPQESGNVLRSWHNDGNGFTVYDLQYARVDSKLQLTSSQAPPLQNPEQACTLANPHSSAYIDIDGDCLPGQLLLPGQITEQANDQISYYIAPQLGRQNILFRYG
jgi:integrin alpha FG-GAP repeat containing protein 1